MSYVPPFTYTLTNGMTADASQVMSNLNLVRDYLNILAANTLPLTGGTINGNLVVTGSLTANTFSVAVSVAVPSGAGAGVGLQVGATNTRLYSSTVGNMDVDVAGTNIWNWKAGSINALTVFNENAVDTLASAATLNLATVSANMVVITGTTQVTAITIPSGADRWLIAVGSFSIQHNSSIYVQGGADYQASVGDRFLVRGTAANTAEVFPFLVGGRAVNTVFESTRNLKVQVTSDTVTTITADNISLFGSNNNASVFTSVSQTPDFGNPNGANGLDTGSKADSTWYNVFLISKPDGTLAGLYSLSATSPTMPSGYTRKVRVGAVRVDGSGNLWRTLQYGNKAQIVIGTNPTTLPNMASGVAGSVGTPTWVAAPVGNFVPPTASEIDVTQGGSNNNGVIVAPNNSYGAIGSTTAPPIAVYDVFSTRRFRMTLESTNIYWASANASGFVSCNGWTDNL